MRTNRGARALESAHSIVLIFFRKLQNQPTIDMKYEQVAASFVLILHSLLQPASCSPVAHGLHLRGQSSTSSHRIEALHRKRQDDAPPPACYISAVGRGDLITLRLPHWQHECNPALESAIANTCKDVDVNLQFRAPPSWETNAQCFVYLFMPTSATGQSAEQQVPCILHALATRGTEMGREYPTECVSVS